MNHRCSPHDVWQKVVTRFKVDESLVGPDWDCGEASGEAPSASTIQSVCGFEAHSKCEPRREEWKVQQDMWDSRVAHGFEKNGAYGALGSVRNLARLRAHALRVAVWRMGRIVIPDTSRTLNEALGDEKETFGRSVWPQIQALMSPASYAELVQSSESERAALNWLWFYNLDQDGNVHVHMPFDAFDLDVEIRYGCHKDK